MRFSVKCALIAKLVIELTSTCEDVASKSALTKAASRRASQLQREIISSNLANALRT
jgi:hypothetical protein